MGSLFAVAVLTQCVSALSAEMNDLVHLDAERSPSLRPRIAEGRKPTRRKLDVPVEDCAKQQYTRISFEIEEAQKYGTRRLRLFHHLAPRFLPPHPYSPPPPACRCQGHLR